MMLQIPKVLNCLFTFLSITLFLLVFILVNNNRLCELRFKSGIGEIEAIMACES